MSPHESSLLISLTDEVKASRAEVQELSRQIGILHTKLFGTDEGENPEGRIPRLESKVAAHGRKLAHWEPIRLGLHGLWLLLVATAGYLFNHFFPFKGH